MSDAGAIFIAGPTASGKSAAAMAVAHATGGEIVNADAMQVYNDLRILTARPSREDEAAAAHHLYGDLDGATRYSAGRWASRAAEVISNIRDRGKIAIITGGTGLYFRALEDGLSPIPETPPDIRDQAKRRHAALGPTAFREEVIGCDPAMERLPEGDTQRLLRAWEVFEATGAPLSSFQELPRAPLVKGSITKAVIMPPRDVLYARCDQRAEAMFTDGAVEEVRVLLARKLDTALPVMKALGVLELASFLRGEESRDAALAQLQQNTRRFAKRQCTWFRNQAADWPVYETAERAIAALT